MYSMPDSEGVAGTPIDGIARQETPIEQPPRDRKKLLMLLLIGAGAFLLFYIVFAFTLLVLLPSPDGGRQGLRLIGNLFYGAVSLLSLAVFVLLVLRLLRSGIPAARLQGLFVRAGIVLLIILGVSGMVFASINRDTALGIDILEPQNLQALTAPLSVTFGTDSLRSILRKQSLFPRKFSWDFNGDGKVDAEGQDQEVTTIYRRKGSFPVILTIQLSDGTTRTAARRINIPNAVFSLDPSLPLLDEEVTFSVEDLIADPKNIDRIVWDFNGDGEDDLETKTAVVKHTYEETGTYQAKVLVQNAGGLQETYTRPVTVLEERVQPFEVSIQTEGMLKGSAPLGITFSAKVPEGIPVREIRWTYRRIEGSGEEEALGERVNHTFISPGEYEVRLTVLSTSGKIAEKKLMVSVLEPLVIRDLVISGLPKPERGKVEGIAPLEVRISPSTNTPFITFRWEQEDASKVFSTDKEYHALYEDAGTYPILLIAKDADDRMQKIPLEINVLPPKSRVTFTASPLTGIAPLTVIFDASQSFVPEGRITGFSWTFGDGGREEKPQLLGAQVSHRFEQEGTFTVTVRALTAEGQSFEAKKTIVVRSALLDACAFPSRTLGDAPMGVRFDASCSTGEITKFLWDFGDGATSEQVVPVQDHVFSSPGSYTVKLEVSDENGNLSNTTLSITVR